MNFFGKEMRELADAIQNVDVGYKKTTTRTTYIENADYEFDEEIWGCIISIDGEKLWNDFPKPITVEVVYDGQLYSEQIEPLEAEDDYKSWDNGNIGIEVVHTKELYAVYAYFGDVSLTVSVYGENQEVVETSPEFENAVVDVTGVGSVRNYVIPELTVEMWDGGSSNEYFFVNQEYSSEEERQWFFDALENKYINEVPFPPFTLEIDGNAFSMAEFNAGDEYNPQWLWRYSSEDEFTIQGVAFNGITVQFEPNNYEYVIVLAQGATDAKANRESADPPEPNVITPTIKAYIDNIVVDENIANAIVDTAVVANPIESATADLTKLQIKDTVYALPQGGAQVCTFIENGYPTKIDGQNVQPLISSMSYDEITEASSNGIVLAEYMGVLARVNVNATKAAPDRTHYAYFAPFVVEDGQGYHLRNASIAIDQNGECVVRYNDSFPISFDEMIA